MRSTVGLIASLVVVALTLLASACSPVAPSTHVCATQPRGYSNPLTGLLTLEMDHYRASACPAEPIK